MNSLPERIDEARAACVSESSRENTFVLLARSLNALKQKALPRLLARSLVIVIAMEGIAKGFGRTDKRQKVKERKTVMYDSILPWSEVALEKA